MDRHRLTRACVALAVAAITAAGAFGTDATPPASARALAQVGGSTALTWAVSEQVTTSMGLTQSRAAVAPATVDATAWTFGDGTGTYNADTGAAMFRYTGALEAGNSAMGNYGFRFADLEVDIDAAGEGVVRGDVSTRGPGSATWSTPVDGVKLATFDAGTPTVNGTTTTWTVTPDTEPVTVNPKFAGAQQFPRSLLDALPAAFWAHFQQTATDGPTSAANLKKLPARISISFSEHVAPPTTAPVTTAPPNTTAPAPTVPSTAGPVVASAGTLTWPIKRSFIGYVESPSAAGTITLGGGAVRTPEGAFAFPLAAGSQYRSVGDLQAPFAGSLHLTAHGGAMDLTLANPSVHIAGPAGTITADVTSKSIDTGETTTTGDVALATLDLRAVQATAAGDEITFADVPATLTADGAPAFGGFYAAGELLDRVTLTLTVHTDEALPEATTPTLGCLPATVTAGDQVRLCGEGFLPGEQVQAFVHSTPRQIGLVTADASGRVDASLTVPADLAPGTHRFELRGVSSGLSVLSADVTVTSSLAAAPLPRTGVDARTLLLGGLGLLVAGLVVMAAARRRSCPTL